MLALFLVFLAAISVKQSKSQENSTNTEVDSDYGDVPENSNEKFNQSFYQKAQSYTKRRKLTSGAVDDLAQYSDKLEKAIHKKMAEMIGLENDSNLSNEDISKLFLEKIDSGEITPAQLATLQAYTTALQEAYIKRVIKVYN